MLFAVALAVLVVAWAAWNLWSGGEGFALLVPDGVVGGEEAASALARLFAALVLGLFLADAVGWRARWVAAGLVALGMGHLVFGYLEPMIQTDPPELGESLYEAFVTQTLACALFAVVLLAGSVLHDYLWPSAYGGGLLTTADGLSLVFAVVVAIGGISELRRQLRGRKEGLIPPGGGTRGAPRAGVGDSSPGPCPPGHGERGPSGRIAVSGGAKGFS